MRVVDDSSLAFNEISLNVFFNRCGQCLLLVCLYRVCDMGMFKLLSHVGVTAMFCVPPIFPPSLVPGRCRADGP